MQVVEPRKELEGQKDAFISYGIRAETNLPHFSRTYMSTRRRFNDFTFLREGLKRDFPACVVAPLPEKHRLEYLTGDRFSNEFIEKRTQELQLFLERICRHPTLQRSQLLRSFLESSEWQVDMHAHNAAHSSTGTAAGASTLISRVPKWRMPAHPAFWIVSATTSSTHSAKFANLTNASKRSERASTSWKKA